MKSFKTANYKKDWVRKSAKCHICRRSANLTNYLSPQICGLAILELICGPPLVFFVGVSEKEQICDDHKNGEAPENNKIIMVQTLYYLIGRRRHDRQNGFLIFNTFQPFSSTTSSLVSYSFQLKRTNMV